MARKRKYTDEQIEALKQYYPDSNYEELYKVFPGLKKENINDLAFYYGIKASRIKNKVGNKYGLLTVVKMLPNFKNGRTYCLCNCDCGGKEIPIPTSNLRYDECGNPIHTTSCGCQSSRNGTKQFDFLHQYRLDSEEKIYSVYKHTAPNGKCYIGMTKQTLEKRSQNGEGYNTQRLFYGAIQKYGWDNFQHEILEDNLTHNEACERETVYINKFKSDQPEYGYNVTSGGDGCCHVKKPFAQIKNGVIVNVFGTQVVAANLLKCSDSVIGNYLKDNKEHGGYIFSYITKDEFYNYQFDLDYCAIEDCRKNINEENRKKRINNIYKSI